MKCPKCGKEMVWMGDVSMLIKDTDKYYRKLTKKAIQRKAIEIWGVNWEAGNLFCPNYLKCGNNPKMREMREQRTTAPGNDFFETFGDRLQYVLDMKEMSHQDFADRIKVSDSTISRWINNEQLPIGCLIIVICNELGVSSDWLLGLNR